MSQPPADWSFSQPYGDYDDEDDVPEPPPPAAPKKAAARPGLEDIKARAREKVDNLESMSDAARFILSGLEADLVCARAELKKVEARKPRGTKVLPPLPPPPAPAPSQASVACEDAVVSKPVVRGVKRVRTAAPEASVGQDGGRGPAGYPVHFHDPQGRKGPSSQRPA